MKTIASLFIFFILNACTYKNGETDRLNRRITLLEQKIDSLTYGRTADTVGFTVNKAFEINRCQKITKKGTQCKRKAKENGYCWQHQPQNIK